LQYCLYLNSEMREVDKKKILLSILYEINNTLNKKSNMSFESKVNVGNREVIKTHKTS